MSGIRLMNSTTISPIGIGLSIFLLHQQERHGIVGEISFVDPQHGDLRLRPGSRGVDGGKVMSIKEYDWAQSYRGAAPDIGAYEDGVLVEGPAFRYMAPPQSQIVYAEKPRIVRHRVEGNKVIIYFSEKIDPSSFRKEDIELFANGGELGILSASFPRDKYELVIETTTAPGSGMVSVSFKRLPVGMNGERVTYWASAMNIHTPGVLPPAK